MNKMSDVERFLELSFNLRGEVNSPRYDIHFENGEINRKRYDGHYIPRYRMIWLMFAQYLSYYYNLDVKVDIRGTTPILSIRKRDYSYQVYGFNFPFSRMNDKFYESFSCSYMKWVNSKGLRQVNTWGQW